ncbi:hypothetical protein METBIDRAFT_29874 [Metschnikowia bicuspidata var. bicuspidata NRRL YB-4993]|uniref:Bul1 N-terminal domain-containing protein n=1 Tax=Metschnikowia bicuspidata var. bicuspidata NRRL YB-4993 TaxID=869754 RepID=A0A1A0HHB9_9ASCO|nr:hypothetical protein METBIDRAFT_29874 [Metschnikowia bicuspidata var. bicuspidata NRRL YB-4993]OBA23395.1 hypothetical protein METBIDRAFT_29874 [Metschnikowia bicuspidata var. bicuspidata NRRL YB-4993]
MSIFQKGFKRGAALGSKFNLDLSKTEVVGSTSQSCPNLPATYLVKSPAHEDVPMWNILPSYQLYESTYAKVVDPLIEDMGSEPPVYEDTPTQLSSSDTGNDYFSQQPNAPGGSPSFRSPEPRWENTILAHAHRMKHVDEFNKLVADKLKIDIHLTKKPGARGRKPEFYSPLEKEFLQGDTIHGHVIVVNTCKEPLSFDMFSVVFEGRMAVNSSDGSGSKPHLFFKFLNMFDFNASWTPVNFEDPLDYIDPVDKTTLQFPTKREFQPGVAYKKFFNFTVPMKLLDCACEVHNIPEHCVLLPSIGLDKTVFLQRLRKLREAPIKADKALQSAASPLNHMHSLGNPSGKKIAPNLITRDYGFPDTSISYSVETKVFGKRSVYERGGKLHNEEFIVVKEASLPLRVIPRVLNSSANEEDDNGYIADKHYEIFVKSVEKCLETGRRLERGVSSDRITRKPSTTKQTYVAAPTATKSQHEEECSKVHFPYRKKHLTQPAKIVGLLNAIIPKRELIVRYETPYIFSPVTKIDTDKLGRLEVPICLEYLSTENDGKIVRAPEIRSISTKIVICTVRSQKYPIPIEFTQNMKFRNVVGTSDGVERYIVAPFKAYLAELCKLITIYGTQALGVSNQLLMDVKCLANLEAKSTSLKIENVKVHSTGGLGFWQTSTDSKKAEKKIFLDVDIQSLFVKDSKRPMEDKLQGALTLVPSFQSCIIGRYYYLLIEIKLGNGETMPVKVPFKISN